MRRLALLCSLFLVFATAACSTTDATGPDQPDPLSPTPPTTVTAQSTTLPSSRTVGPSTTPPAASMSEPGPESVSDSPSDTPGLPVAGTWSDDIPGLDIRQAQAALAGFARYTKLRTEALADPAAKDWESDILEVTAGPMWLDMTWTVEDLAATGKKYVVPDVYGVPTAVSVDDFFTTIQVCVFRGTVGDDDSAENTDSAGNTDGDAVATSRPFDGPANLEVYTVKMIYEVGSVVVLVETLQPKTLCDPSK